MRYQRDQFNALTEDEQLALIKKDGLLLQLADDQTEALCLAAVKQNGCALQWVKNASLKILLQVVISWESLSPGYITAYGTHKSESRPEFFDSAVDCRHSRIKGWLEDTSPSKNISVYSDLSGRELKSIHDRLALKYAEIFNDETIGGIQERLERIRTYLERGCMPPLRVSLKDFVREWFYRQLQALSALVYIFMQKQADFGDIGADNIYAGYLRNIMAIPHDSHIDLMNTLHFDFVLRRYNQANGFKSAEEYMALTKKLSLELFENILFEKEIKEAIAFLETDVFYNSCGNRFGAKYIFGRKQEKTINDSKIITITEEYARTPQYTLSNVAWANKDGMTLRDEAFATLFSNKYKDYYQTANFFQPDEPNSAICDGLKEKVLKSYHAYTAEDTVRIGAKLIEELKLCVIAHEEGHRAVDALIGLVHENIRGAFSNDGDNAIYTINEASADWFSTIPYYLKIAKEKGPQAIARAIWLDISGNWFLDDVADEEQHFALMTKVSVGLLLPFIRCDGSIDVPALDRQKDMIRQQLLNRMEKIILRLFNLIEISEYQIPGFNLDYRQLEDGFFEVFKEDKNDFSRDDLKKDWQYWYAVARVLKSFSAEGNRKLEEILTEEAVGLEDFVLKAAHAKPGISLLDYIYGRFEEMGIFRKKTEFRTKNEYFR